MKNLNLSINEVSKAEKCECTEVCEACAEKYKLNVQAPAGMLMPLLGDIIRFVPVRFRPAVQKFKNYIFITNEKSIIYSKFGCVRSFLLKFNLHFRC